MLRSFARIAAVLATCCSVASHADRRVPFVDLSLPKVAITAAPVAAQPANVEARLRPRPDRRFLLALSDLHELLTGTRVTPEINFTNGKWVVRASNRDLGSLPELPTFNDGFELLTRTATALGAKPGDVAQLDASPFYATSLFERAKKAEPATLAEAATLINVQTIDRFGIADPLRARALALIAIARASGANTNELAGTLAGVFGYEREQLEPRATSALARAYMAARKDPGDARLAQVPASALPLFLATAEMHERPVRGTAAAHVIAADVANERQFARATAAQAVAMFDDANAFPRALAKFERAIAAKSQALASAAFPADIVRLHYEAQFLTAIFESADAYLDDYASKHAASALAGAFAHVSTPAAAAAGAWLQSAIAAKYDRGGAAPPADAIAHLELLGGATRARLLIEYSNALGVHDPGVRAALYALVPQLDTRPEELRDAGLLVSRVLNDASRRALYLETALERAPSLADTGLRAWYYRMQGDVAQLRAIALDANAPADDRGVALTYLADLEAADHAWITAQFERLLVETRYEVYTTLVGYLNERREWKTKERLARQWFATKALVDEATPVEHAYYASSLADALEQQGRHEEAWKVVAPLYDDVWSYNILTSAASALDHLGKHDEAIALAKSVIERYPGAAAHVDLAKLYWRRGRHAEAAELFDAKHRLNSGDLASEFSPTFFETFRERPSDAAPALAALARHVEPWFIGQLVSAATRNEPALGIALAEQAMTLPGFEANSPQGVSVRLDTWEALRKSRDAQAATVWLQPRLPDAAAVQFAVIAYQDAYYELLLAYTTGRPELTNRFEILTLAAASALHLRLAPDEPRRKAIVERVRALTDDPKGLRPSAEYLLDLRSEAEFLKSGDASVVAYFVGLKAAARGDYDRAVNWLLAAAEGPAASPPRVWAIELLQRWNGAQRSWRDVVRSGVLTPQNVK